MHGIAGGHVHHVDWLNTDSQHRIDSILPEASGFHVTSVLVRYFAPLNLMC